MSNGVAPSLQSRLLQTIPVPPLQHSIDPGTDFYRHVNDIWNTRTTIPSYISSYGVSEEIERVLQDFLLQDISSAARTSPIGIVVRSAEATGPQQRKANVEGLIGVLRSFFCIKDYEDIATTLGSMARRNIPTILDVYVAPKDGGQKTEHRDYCIHISIGSVGLPDVVYYKGGDPAHTEVLGAYVRLIQTLCKRLGLEEDLSAVIPFEATLAAYMAKADSKLATDTAEYLTLAELSSKCSAIPWRAFAAAYGVPAARIETLCFQVESLAWLEYLDRGFRSTPLQEWKRIFALHTLLHALPYLPPPFDTLHFDVFGRRLGGQKQKTPQRILTLQVIKEKMPFQLGRLFVQKYLTAGFKKTVESFVEKIRSAAVQRLAELEWMGAATRRRAAAKVAAMELSIGYSRYVATPPPSLDPESFLKNIYVLDEALTNFNMGKMLQDLPKGVWDDPPYIVNAYYYHETNEMVVPAGNFLWPFYRFPEEQWMGWNYGGIGAVVAHEIVHAFDQEGRYFNEKGKLESWWSAADERNYKTVVGKLIRLFDKGYVGKEKISGAATLDENLADLGSIAISLNALKNSLVKGGYGREESKRHMREFFVSYTISWRTKEHPARRIQRIVTDHHAPFELRVNYILPQFQEWYDAFDVKPGAALYIEPEDRIRIF